MHRWDTGQVGPATGGQGEEKEGIILRGRGRKGRAEGD